MKRLIPLIALACALAAAPAALAANKNGAVDAVPDAKVKITIGHLHGGKAQVMSTVPVIGTVSPYAPGQSVDVSFFLNGKRIEHKSVKVQKGKGDSGSFRARIRIDGGRQVRGQRPPRPDRPARRRQQRAQELAGQLPLPAPGPVRRRRRRLQEGDAEAGLHRQQRPLLRRQDRRAASSPTAKSTT